MTPLRFFILFLALFSIVKILFFSVYLRMFKPRPLTKEQLARFDREDDVDFFEEDD